MRRILAIGGLLALAAPLLVLVPSTLEPAYAFPPTGGIGWQYHEGSGSYYQDPPSAPGETGPSQRPTRYVDWGEGDMASYTCPTEYDGSPFDCSGENDPTNDFCNSLPGENGRPVAPRITFEREFNNPQQNGNPPWRPLPPADWDQEHAVQSCHELPEEYVVTPEEIQDEVNYEVFQRLEGLAIDVHPSQNNRTLVNLSTIVSTRYPENVDLIDQVVWHDFEGEKPAIRIRDNIEGKVSEFWYTIEAEADLNWEFEEGNPSTAQGRGHPYNGTLPEDAPAGYYITTQFHRADERTITLSAVWTGTVLVDAPGEEERPIEPVEINPPATRVIQVSEATSVITD